ncbi:NAD(P)-binding domain-containing protein [Paenibacillus hamazuiensis]|uniref:NAD(P)-binding domain-containing protein n=1 Tax=Paenibacillus hamazuiensis TaxID=2936508 RepID=UPI0030846D4C
MKMIGFIGLGTMGSPMAANLLDKGYNVIVYNRTREKADELARRGADVADSPAEVARQADVVFTMLSNDQALLETFHGENGIMHGLRPGTTVIDCSTVSPETSRKLHEELAAHFCDFLDAPVAGSKPAAESGALSFMVGGSREVLDEHKAILEAMGKLVVHMGPAGSGSTAKLANNTIVAINTLGLIEGMSMAAKAGIDPEAFLKVLLSGGASSRMAELKGERILDRDFSTQFALELMLKDLLLAGDLTARHQLPSPLLKAATGIFQMGLSRGLGAQDLSAIAMCYEDWMHAQIAKKAAPPQAAAEPAKPEPFGRDRRKGTRVQMNVKLLLSVYEWEQEGSFSGQQIEGMLYDLSESGLQIVSDFPLTKDMFVVIHFPQEAELPPIIGRIIRITPDGTNFRYGCMLSGLPLYVRLKLEEYIKRKVEAGTSLA